MNTYFIFSSELSEWMYLRTKSSIKRMLLILQIKKWLYCNFSSNINFFEIQNPIDCSLFDLGLCWFDVFCKASKFIIKKKLTVYFRYKFDQIESSILFSIVCEFSYVNNYSLLHLELSEWMCLGTKLSIKRMLLFYRYRIGYIETQFEY